MAALQPHVRQAGSGARVLCLHSNASHAGQWRQLMDLLSPRFEVVAVDSYGAGKSPDWPGDRPLQLADEVDFIEPLLGEARGPVFLVGHSYGAAVALKAALMHPDRVAGLALYEPTLFSLVAASPAAHRVDGIARAVDRAAGWLEAGDPGRAAGEFIDFWMGAGSWAQMPADRKPAIAATARHVRRWGHALFTERAALEDFASLRMPLLYLSGDRSPESSLSVEDMLRPVLAGARHLRFPGLGHMGPITHPSTVNAAIDQFLAENAMPARP